MTPPPSTTNTQPPTDTDRGPSTNTELSAARKSGPSLLKWRPSILAYFICMNFVLLFLLFPAISILFLNEGKNFQDLQLNRTINQMREGLETRSASLVRSIALSANQAIAGFNFSFLALLATQVADNDPEIAYCIIMDTNGIAVAHSNPVKNGLKLDGPVDIQAISLLPSFPQLILETDTAFECRFLEVPAQDSGEPAVMEAVTPLYNGAKLWGVLRCGYSLTRYHRQIETTRTEWAGKLKQFKIYLASMTFVFLSLGTLIAFFFTRGFLRPMAVIGDGVRRVAREDLESSIQHEGLVCYEFYELSEAFNKMTSRLRESRDLLEQKVDERTRELREAQEKLLQQAHEAGMAEMAVGILHNIGNAITPAKVGNTLLAKRLRESPVRRHITRIMTQINGILSGTTPPNDEEKTKLLRVVELLPRSIEEEYTWFVSETERIADKHEHIESIIHLQMRYARLAGSQETVAVNEIIRDALELLEDALGKREIEVTTHLGEVPSVRIEKPKLMQILVNLIKNAYESMEQSDRELKQLTIVSRLEEPPQNEVVVVVRDTGIGFSAEASEKLFNFGFTTKTRGSGFGLHSSANYLIANNGRLTARSEGPGLGAEFTVHLPAAPQTDPAQQP